MHSDVARVGPGKMHVHKHLKAKTTGQHAEMALFLCQDQGLLPTQVFDSEIVSHLSQVGLELAMWPRWTLNFRSCGLYLQVGIAALCPYAHSAALLQPCFVFFFFLFFETGLYYVAVNILEVTM